MTRTTRLNMFIRLTMRITKCTMERKEVDEAVGLLIEQALTKQFLLRYPA
jgi:hypothetical protein